MPYKDPEIRRIKSREYTRKFKEENKDALAERRRANKEVENAKNRAAYHANHDKSIERERAKWKDPEYREAQKRRAAKWRAAHPGAKRKDQLKRKYGLTLEQYAEMLKAQDGKCYICKQADKVHLSVDHDHSTGKVRDLLCRKCNSGIGQFKENIALLELAILYLKRHSTT